MGPLSFIYYLGYALTKSYQLKHQKRLPHKVISVGNITLGGTGKTPAVIAIAEEARKRGHLPFILTRGYKGKANGPCFISKGDGALLSVDEAGDEASLIAERLRDVIVVKGKDRHRSGMLAIRELASQPSAISHRPFLFILDDGFQHWRLFRDKDILLVDNSNPFGNNKLFPSGMLREPLGEMKRADVIVITKVHRHASGDVNIKPGLLDEIRKHNPGAPIYTSGQTPVSLITVSGSELPLEQISGRTVYAFCGIGNPGFFQDTLAALNARVRGFRAFRDHYRYTRTDIDRIKKTAKQHNADWIVTTEKDIMRLKGFDIQDTNIVSLRIDFTIEKGFYEELFAED